MGKEPINKFEILEMARECAAQGDLFAQNIRKTEELSVSEKLMLMSFTNAEMLHKNKMLPNEQKNAIIRSINTECQRFEIDIQRNKEYFERQIEVVQKTEKLRTDLANQLNSGDFETALETAVKLADACCFGIAKSCIYQKILDRAKNAKEKKYA